MMLAELGGTATWLLHLVGLLLLCGRLADGAAQSFLASSMLLRTGGMALPLAALGIGAALGLLPGA